MAMKKRRCRDCASDVVALRSSDGATIPRFLLLRQEAETFDCDSKCTSRS
jgi:hypothetical protein